MKKLNELIKVLDEYFGNIDNGDQYIEEDGLQLDLYLYLKDLGYQVVYELSLPKLKPYLDKELNESVGFSGFQKDSLRPDLVVNLEDEGFACFELKYNETDDEEIEEDLAKCRVFIKQCKDVHFAEFIHLSKHGIVSIQSSSCKDWEYEYGYYGVWDNIVGSDGLHKSPLAYSISDLWEERLEEIEEGGGKFAEYE